MRINWRKCIVVVVVVSSLELLPQQFWIWKMVNFISECLHSCCRCRRTHVQCTRVCVHACSISTAVIFPRGIMATIVCVIGRRLRLCERVRLFKQDKHAWPQGARNKSYGKLNNIVCSSIWSRSHLSRWLAVAGDSAVQPLVVCAFQFVANILVFN